MSNYLLILIMYPSILLKLSVIEKNIVKLSNQQFQNIPTAFISFLCSCLNVFQFQSVCAHFSTVHLSFLTPLEPRGTFPFIPLHPSIHPSAHLTLSWRPVSSCNFCGNHTFVFVPVIKLPGFPLPTLLPECYAVVKNALWLSAAFWRSESNKICGEWERLHPPYLGHSLAWMVGTAVTFKYDSRKHIFMSARMPLRLPPSVLTAD